jgi:diguanylate cyclase (GGDEF)-like protein/PAS domain S-box-containing protein
MSVQIKIWASVGLMLLLGFSLVLVDQYRAMEAFAMEEVREDVRALRGLLMATRRVYHHQFLESGVALDDDTLGFLPAHALSRISRDFREWYGTGLSFNNVSDRARNPDNQADQHELEAIRYFRQNPEELEYITRFLGDDEREIFLFAQPIWTEPYCVGCHGPKDQTPETIARLYDEGFDYHAGDLRGIISIKVPSKTIRERKNHYILLLLRDQLVIFLLTLLFGGWLLRRLVIGKLMRVEQQALHFANGDFDRRMAVEGSDEIARLGDSFNRMANGIQARERQLAEALAFADMSLCHYDPSTGVMSWSDRIIEMLDLTEPKMERGRFRELIHPEDLARADEVFQETLEEGKPHSHDFRLILPEGRVIWVNCRARPVEDDQGRVCRIEGFLQNVSERKQAELALLDLNKRMEVATDASAIGVWELDVPSQHLVWNDWMFSIYGLSPRTFKGVYPEWKVRVHPEDAAKADAAVRQAIDSGDDFNGEFRILRPNGEVRYILSSASVVLDEQGGAQRLIGTNQDVTQRKQAERVLRQERDRAQHYLDVAGVVIIALDQKGTVTMINRRGCQLIGRPEEGIVGRCWFDEFLPRDHLHQVKKIFSMLMRGQLEPVEFVEGQILTNSGEVLSVAWHNSLLRDEAGEIIGILSSGEDVTKRNRAMAALEKERSFLQNVIDGIDEPVMVIGRDYQVIRANAQALPSQNGWDGTPVPPCHQLLHDSETPCAGENLPCPMRAVLATGEPHRVIHRHPSRDQNGKELLRTYEIIASPMCDDRGEVSGIIEASRDITDHLRLLAQLKEQEISYAHLEQHDTLTGLPNRVLLADRLEQAIQGAQRRDLRLALLVVDVDGFKHINDSLGHFVGDELLKQVAHRLASTLRSEDTLARFGGDEFGVLLHSIASTDDAALVARKLLALFEGPLEVGEHRLAVGISIGISIFPGPARDASEMVRNADAALHRAKESGRNTFEYYAEEMTSHALERVMLEASLREALEYQQFVLYYQPQFELATNRITGFEALVRWKHPQMGLVSPQKFIPLAEETGIIIPLGEWVLRQACRQMQHWREAGLVDTGDQMCVNLSARQFAQPDLIQRVQAALIDTCLEPACLELEITESAMMMAPEQSASLLRKLREVGVKIAIDDFGTGYSSLSYLKLLPFTKLKIDQSFVADIPGDEDNMAITRSIVGLGNSLSLDVLAEGIETEAQRKFLEEIGCVSGQGFLLAKPLQVEEVEGVLSGSGVAIAVRHAERSEGG